MPLYVILMNLTDEGLKGIKESPKRVKKAKEMVESVGGEIIELLYTDGPYDLVGIIDFPDEKTGFQTKLGYESQGAGRITTMRAFSTKEAAEMINKLP